MEHNQGLGLVTSCDFVNEFNSVSAKGLPGTSGTGNYKGWRTAERVIRRNRSEEHVLDCGFVASAGTLYTSAEMVCHNQKPTESVFAGLCLLQPHTKRRSMALTG